MDIVKSLSDSIGLVGALISDIEAAVAAGGGVVQEGVTMVEKVVSDPKVQASIAALIADIKG